MKLKQPELVIKMQIFRLLRIPEDDSPGNHSEKSRIQKPCDLHTIITEKEKIIEIF